MPHFLRDLFERIFRRFAPAKPRRPADLGFFGVLVSRPTKH